MFMPDDGPLWTEICSILSLIMRIINVSDTKLGAWLIISKHNINHIKVPVQVTSVLSRSLLPVYQTAVLQLNSHGNENLLSHLMLVSLMLNEIYL
jgi:hypothetical protein